MKRMINIMIARLCELLCLLLVAFVVAVAICVPLSLMLLLVVLVPLFSFNKVKFFIVMDVRIIINIVR